MCWRMRWGTWRRCRVRQSGAGGRGEGRVRGTMQPIMGCALRPAAGPAPTAPLLHRLPERAHPPAGGGDGAQQRGKDMFGAQALPALLAVLLAPDAGAALLPAKRSASAGLLEFLLNSKANCEVLAGQADRFVGRATYGT